MRQFILLFVFGILLGTGTAVHGQESGDEKTGETETAESLYQEALFEETANGDLEAAQKLYRKIVEKFSDETDPASRALFRIGMLQGLRGKVAEAKKTFEDLVETYGEELEEKEEESTILARAKEEIAALAKRQERDRKEEKVESLVRRLRGLSWRKKIKAISGLSDEQDRDYLPILHDFLSDEEDSRVQMKALDALEEMGDRTSFHYLFEAMQSPKQQVATRAEEVLNSLSNRMATVAPGELVGGLSNRNPYERYHLIEILRNMPSHRLIPELLGKLDDPDPQVRYYVIILLGNKGNKRCISRLKERLDDPFPENRLACARALKKLGSDAGHEVVRKALDHRSEHIRVSAAHHLTAWKDPAGARILVKQLSNLLPDHRKRAIRALESLFGTRLGYDPMGSEDARRTAIRKWREYLEKR